MHNPVLLQEVIDALKVKKGGLYIDATLGEGGHTLAILRKGGRVLGIDLDRQQISNFHSPAKELTSNRKNLILIEGNFKNIERIAKKNNFYPVDGVLFDLGLSIGQIQHSGRGFSFKKSSEPLDMRLSNRLKIKASDLVNGLSQEELCEIFSKYSEEINSTAISKAIVRGRCFKKITTVADLTKIIDQAIGRKDEKVYQRIFQALRIVVNDEFENLKEGLKGAVMLLKKNGRIAVITFHSLEDRIVKRFIHDNQLKLVTKKPIVSKNNIPFERSAKLRVIKL